MKSIEAIRELVEQLDMTIKIGQVDEENGNYKIYTCNPLYANVCTPITIDGVTYKVLDIGVNWILVSGDVVPSAESFTLQPFTFKHGTPTDVNTELKIALQTSQKVMPLAYLIDAPMTEVWSNDYDYCFNDVEVRLFLLGHVDTFDCNSWCIDDHYKQIICPMLNVAKRINDTIDNHRHFGKVPRVTIRHRKDFGVYKSNKGVVEGKIFDIHTSGIEMVFTLPIKQSHNCCKFA